MNADNDEVLITHLRQEWGPTIQSEAAAVRHRADLESQADGLAQEILALEPLRPRLEADLKDAMGGVAAAKRARQDAQAALNGLSDRKRELQARRQRLLKEASRPLPGDLRAGHLVRRRAAAIEQLLALGVEVPAEGDRSPQPIVTVDDGTGHQIRLMPVEVVHLFEHRALARVVGFGRSGAARLPLPSVSSVRVLER